MALVRTDVSEESIASIVKAERIGVLGTTLQLYSVSLTFIPYSHCIFLALLLAPSRTQDTSSMRCLVGPTRYFYSLLRFH
jgi:hypothetical protein